MANFYRIGAAGLNWSNVGSWSSTSGGASNGSAEPTSSDDVFFDTNSPASVTVTSAASGASCSLTKSGLTITLNGGSVTISGTTTISSNPQVINKTSSETWSSSGFTANTSITGTTKVILTGGTWSGSNTAGIANDLDLQGNVTVSGNVYYRTGTLQYVSGTITVTSSTLNLTGSCTLNTNGMSWNNLSLGAATYTLTSSFLMGGNLTTNAGDTAINKTTSETFTIGGNVQTGTNHRVAGTADIYITGGTWGSNGSSNTNWGYIANNVFLQGDVIMDGPSVNGNTFTYISGTITTTGSTLILRGNVTLDIGAVTWNNIRIGVASVITINSHITANQLEILDGVTHSFLGSFGFTVNTFTDQIITAQTITLKDGVTYTITTLFDCKASRVGAIVLFTSSHASNRANILMPNNGNNVCNILADFTRINASGGRSIATYGGVVTDCINVVQYTDWKGVAL